MSFSPTIIPGLRSPYDTVGGIVIFGRLLDKIRLHAQEKLPEDWLVAKGLAKGFDGRCIRFLQVDYDALEAETLTGPADDELLEWAFANGRKPTVEEIEVWNGFMMKYGWRDGANERLTFRLDEAGLPPDAADTMFDFIELDEGRQPRGK